MNFPLNSEPTGNKEWLRQWREEKGGLAMLVGCICICTSLQKCSEQVSQAIEGGCVEDANTFGIRLFRVRPRLNQEPCHLHTPGLHCSP